MSTVFRLRRPPDPATLGALWQAVAARYEASFFQDWAWTGALFAERFPDPWLLSAERNGETLGLALFNRTRRLGRSRLWLGESGAPEWDRLFIEYNGWLGDPALAAAAWRAARRAGAEEDGRGSPFGRELILSGIDTAGCAAARAAGRLHVRQSRVAPAIDLDVLCADGRDYLALLSANTRQQLRRSDARHAAAGALRIDAATTQAEAEDFLDRLIVLHQASWQRRGQPGAFADPRIPRFHRALIAEALPRGNVELLRIAAGETPVGYLYNFRSRRRVLSYQSGFAYAPADPHRKPGLTCHHQAIRRALENDDGVYDFLAGAERYKQSLVPQSADASTTLYWAELGTLRGLIA